MKSRDAYVNMTLNRLQMMCGHDRQHTADSVTVRASNGRQTCSYIYMGDSRMACDCMRSNNNVVT